MEIKQYGLQRTGTNIVKALLEANCPGAVVLSNSHGSKHEAPTVEAVDAVHFFVVNIKDPVSWLASYHRYRAMRARDESPARRIDPVSTLAPEWLALWEKRTGQFLNLAVECPDRVVVVQHESVVRDPGWVLRMSADRLGLDVVDAPELFLKGYARRGSENDRGQALVDRRRMFDREYHLNAGWAGELPRETVRRARLTMDEFFRDHPGFRPFFNLSHLGEV